MRLLILIAVSIFIIGCGKSTTETLVQQETAPPQKTVITPVTIPSNLGKKLNGLGYYGKDAIFGGYTMDGEINFYRYNNNASVDYFFNDTDNLYFQGVSNGTYGIS